ncbi:MAG: hypothetical protein ACWGQW_05810 [bacterium]
MINTIQICLLLVCTITTVSGTFVVQGAPVLVPTLGQSAQEAQLSQARAREATFREASEGLTKADGLSAGLLSPKYYAEARKSFKKAQEIYDRGGKLADVRSNLSKCMQNLDLAIRTAELCQVGLKEVLVIRNEALASGLSFDRSNDFREADKKLSQAAAKIEKGDLKGSSKPSNQAAERYRKAVLQVLDKEVIPDAKKRLKSAKRAYSKEEYKQAEDKLKNLEQRVKSQKNASFSVAELTSEVNNGIEQALRQSSPGS